MEKRTLLAFALCILVLVVWQTLFYKPPKKVIKGQGEKAVPSQATSAEKKVKEEKKAKAPAPTKNIPGTIALPKHTKPAMEGKQVIVDTPYYKATFSSRGGVLKSFLLKKYRETIDMKSPPKELVRVKDRLFSPLLTEFLDHRNTGLAYANFTPDRQELRLSKNDKSGNVRFSWESPEGIKVTKVFTFYPESYLFDMEIGIVNESQKPFSDSLVLNVFNMPYQSEESRYNKNEISVLKTKKLLHFNEKKILKSSPKITGPFEWLGYENNYFISALIPKEIEGYSALINVMNENTKLVRVAFVTPQIDLASREKTKFGLRFFVGPKDLNVLKKVNYDLAKSINFGWFDIIAKPLLWSMDFTNRYVHNYGIAIIIVTVIIKILFWPLTHKSYQSMKTMKKLQPKMAAMREKYKDDKEKLNKELMGLYKTYKVNPVGGCLPMVLQIPVFFALYRMLYGAIELRHAPFWLWINDLSAPDRLSIGFNIPYLGGLPVLTILMGVSMFIQQKMTPTGGDPRQEKLMLMMPVVFTVFFVNFPSGLVLYWLVNNILSIGQQYFINKSA